MKIAIIPSIREIYKNQYEQSVDLRLLLFLKKIFKKCNIIILSQKEKINFDLLCLSGGNDIYKKSKNSLIRRELDNYYYRKAKRKKIPILGI